MRQHNVLDWDMFDRIPPMQPQVVRQETIPDGVTLRDPIVGRLTYADMSRSGKQWSVIAAQTRNAVVQSPEAREVLVQVATQPVIETLPYEAVGLVAERHEPLARTLQAASHINSLLRLPAVPESAWGKSVRHTPVALVTNKLAYHSAITEPDDYRKALGRSQIVTEQGIGMTTDEKRLSLQRLEFAREVKVLGLMAELHDHPFEGVAKDGLVSYKLPSGTELALSEEAFAAEPNLLDPAKWEEREQIKDRVFRVQIDGKQYIMKERKTSGHGDVRDDADSLTSQQEYEVARTFAEKGTVTKGDVSLRWEKPLGYAAFPDGYQFCIFESDDVIKSSGGSANKAEMEAAIAANPEAYAEEFQAINAEAAELLQTRPDLIRKPITEAALELLTLREFASVKAEYAVDEARQLLTDTIAEAGYVDIDNNAFAMDTQVENGRAKVNILGFDFEYYARAADAPDVYAEKRQQDADGTTAKVYALHHKRPQMTAASYAVMRRMGWALPPTPNT